MDSDFFQNKAQVGGVIAIDLCNNFTTFRGRFFQNNASIRGGAISSDNINLEQYL